MRRTRRQFLTSLGAMSAGSVVLAGDEPGKFPASPAKKLRADVVVIGGGPAGTVAAIQAARCGARTVLVEANSQLGGTTTTAGVDIPGLFHAWGKQVIAGIGWELVSKAVALYGGKMPDFSKPTGRQHWKHQVRVNGQFYAAVVEEACIQAGVQLRYYEFPLAAEQVSDGWKVRLAGKGLQADVITKQLIDCTGNASVIGMIGLPRLREQTTQPGTLIYRLGGYNLAQVDQTALETDAAMAVKSGSLKRTDMNGGICAFLKGGGENGMHIMGADSSTSESHTGANIAGRQSVLRMWRFLKDRPGFEQLKIERLQTETGVRETYRIVGETMVTVGDYVGGRVFDDAIAYSFYPIDLHDEHGVKPEPLREGVVPTIPLGALIPKSSRNLMVAGRCISSDRLANSALRIQASCMAMGQAAGAACAVAAGKGTPSGDLLPEIRGVLLKHGAILPAKAS